MSYIASLAGVRYVVDHDAKTLSPVERADTRRPMGPQTAGDSRRLRAAELKRRRKGAQRAPIIQQWVNGECVPLKFAGIYYRDEVPR